MSSESESSVTPTDCADRSRCSSQDISGEMSHESDSGGLTTPSTSLGDLPLSRSPARPGGGHRKNIPEKLESRLQVRSERFWFEEGNVIFEVRNWHQCLTPSYDMAA